jgi:hypothetical protein
MQGYFFARPMPQSEVETFIANCRISDDPRMPQCHHAVTHNLAKLTEQLFVAGTMVPGLASNCSTLELLNVRNADRLSARDALRVDWGDTGGAGRLPAIKIIQLIQGNESHASSNIEGRG